MASIEQPSPKRVRFVSCGSAQDPQVNQEQDKDHGDAPGAESAPLLPRDKEFAQMGSTTRQAWAIRVMKDAGAYDIGHSPAARQRVSQLQEVLTAKGHYLLANYIGKLQAISGLMALGQDEGPSSHNPYNVGRGTGIAAAMERHSQKKEGTGTGIAAAMEKHVAKRQAEEAAKRPAEKGKAKLTLPLREKSSSTEDGR